MRLRAVGGRFSGRFLWGTLLWRWSIVAGYLKVYDIIPKILNVYGWYLDSWIGVISGDCGYQM